MPKKNRKDSMSPGKRYAGVDLGWEKIKEPTVPPVEELPIPRPSPESFKQFSNRVSSGGEGRRGKIELP